MYKVGVFSCCSFIYFLPTLAVGRMIIAVCREGREKVGNWVGWLLIHRKSGMEKVNILLSSSSTLLTYLSYRKYDVNLVSA